MKRNYIDIETGPWHGAPEFDWSTVKLGNLKDPDKIKAKRAEAAREYEDKLALSPMTGEVLAIGVQEHDHGYQVIHGDNEKGILEEFLFWLNNELFHQHYICGWNLKGFDLPFIRHRAFLHGLGHLVPVVLYDNRGYEHSCIKDLMLIWSYGKRGSDAWIGIDKVAKFLGHDGKQGITGKEFAKYYNGSPEQQRMAMEYLKTDVEMLEYIADRILF